VTDRDPIIPVFVPSLRSTLRDRERSKGSPLTEAEVLEIRGRAPTMRIRLSEAAKLAKSRGYDDLDPDHVWEEWTRVRDDLKGPPKT
jgi:hypothetical protein